MSKQLKLNLVAIPPKKQWYIHNTGSHGVFGTFIAFPTLVPGIYKGVHTKTHDVEFYRLIKTKHSYFRVIQFYG